MPTISPVDAERTVNGTSMPLSALSSAVRSHCSSAARSRDVDADPAEHLGVGRDRVQAVEMLGGERLDRHQRAGQADAEVGGSRAAGASRGVAMSTTL